MTFQDSFAWDRSLSIQRIYRQFKWLVPLKFGNRYDWVETKIPPSENHQATRKITNEIDIIHRPTGGDASGYNFGSGNESTCS